MNTIIINEKDMDTMKYDGCQAEFMFDDFNMIINCRDEGRVKVEVRTDHDNKVMLFRADREIWYGIKYDLKAEDVYPEPGQMSIIVYDNQDVSIGELYLPIAQFTKMQDFKMAASRLFKNYEACLWLLTIITSYMVCIMMMGEERKRVIRQQNSSDKKNVSHSVEKGNKKKNRVFYLDDIVEYIANHTETESHHTIKCKCWDVRGHYRHYKSGKTVFIKSYRKGKQRDNVEPKSKEYIV